MSYLYVSKQNDMFNDTTRYLDDVFTIDNREFEKHIPDIYQTDLQVIKANVSVRNFFPGFEYKDYWHLRPYQHLQQTL